MKRSPFLAILVVIQLLVLRAHGQLSPTFETAWSLGLVKYSRLNAVDVDREGNQYYAGTITHQVDLDPTAAMHSFSVNGDADIVVYKLDANHQFVWGRQMGSPYAERVTQMKVDNHQRSAFAGPVTTTFDIDAGAGQVMLSNSQSHRAYLARLDANGNFMWAAPMKCTSSLSISDFAFDKYDNLYMMGNFRGKADLDPGTDTLFVTAGDPMGDLFVMKLDVLGNLVWGQRIAGTNADDATSIYVDERNDLVLTGTFKNTIDLDPGPGQALFQSNGGSDLFICKLNTDGDFMWGRTIGNSNNDRGLGLQGTNDDALYLFGTCQDVVDGDPGPGVLNVGGQGVEGMYLLKMDTACTVLANSYWVIQTPNLEPNNWEVFPDGSLQFVGRFHQTTDFNPGPGNFPLTPMGSEDAFMFVLGATGQFMWAGRFGGPQGFVHPASTTMDRFGNMYMVGQFQAEGDFDPGSGLFNLDGGTHYNGYVVKLHRQYENTVGLSETSAGFELWPNPGDGRFQLQLPRGSHLQGLRVYNSMGQEVAFRHAELEGEIPLREDTVVVELEAAAGVYWVQVRTDLVTGTVKWVRR